MAGNLKITLIIIVCILVATSISKSLPVQGKTWTNILENIISASSGQDGKNRVARQGPLASRFWAGSSYWAGSSLSSTT